MKIDLTALKSQDFARLDNDEAVALVTLGRGVAHGYEAYKLTAPSWLTSGVEALHLDVVRRRHDMLAARKRDVEGQLISMRSREEKVDALQGELAALNDALGQS